MPLIADPGYALARDVAGAGLPVTAAPGASASLTALSLSGLPSDRFLFAGFAPSTKGARRSWLTDLVQIPATLILFESPKRIHHLLSDLCDIAGETRDAAICRELTKKFEEVLRGSLADLRDTLSERRLKGEIVLVLGRGEDLASDIDMEEALRQALQSMSVKDAAAHVATACNLPRRKVYQAALALGKGDVT